MLETTQDRKTSLAENNSAQAQTQSRSQALAEFYSAPETALFGQRTIAHVRDCSTATLERDRWAGSGIPFIKIGRAVKYRKTDTLAWLEQYQPQQSTSV
jgi:hypothetical protein